jgi:NAD(P)-dependent dehydrogenase (short-subunit alcohol dehydrogenase family)
MTDRKVVLVVGAGDATGGAIARRFAREGFTACVARRNADKLAPLVARIEAEGGRARAFGSDARREEQMVALVETIEREEGAIEVAVFNIGGNVRFPIRETTARVYFKVWEMCAFAGFLMGREVAKVMLPRGRGTILFTGATASVRGGADRGREGLPLPALRTVRAVFPHTALQSVVSSSRLSRCLPGRV